MQSENSSNFNTDLTVWESAENFKLLVDAVKDYAIYMLDTEGYIRSWNPGAQRAKQYASDEIIGQHFSVFYTPEDKAIHLPQTLLKKALNDGRVEDEGWRVRKDGTRFWADVIVTAVFDGKGNHRGFAKVTRDMTERRQLTDARDDAVRASQAKSIFLANMSHELRTPLNAIMGYAELIEDQLHDSGTADMALDVERILYSARHLLSIVNDVLDLSKVEAGEFELNPEVISISDLLNETVSSIKPLAECNNNEIQVIVNDRSASMTADRIRLRQILYNLLSNAAKFTRNGTITISATSAKHGGQDVIQFDITDTGRGIPEDQVPLIFKRFYQVEQAADHQKRGGTGLGLAICNMLCEAMGGKITMKSIVGKGTTFTVTLPHVSKTNKPEAVPK